MSEREDALALANRLLDEPYADPDDDLRVLARQLLRERERAFAAGVEAMRKAAINYHHTMARLHKGSGDNIGETLDAIHLSDAKGIASIAIPSPEGTGNG